MYFLKYIKKGLGPRYGSFVHGSWPGDDGGHFLREHRYKVLI